MKIKKIETNYNRKLFFKETETTFSKDLGNIEKELITLHPEIEYQKIIGFGGAFTESSGYSLSRCSDEIYSSVINEYFSETNLGYTLCRTPIGSSDFSLAPYSYLYDENINNFSIKQDKKYIIPMIKKAMEVNKNIKLIASPWSPPSFMKNNKNLCNGGKLLKEYYPLWTKYLERYLKEYEKHGITINYMTIQNEPNASQSWESCIYSAREESELLSEFIAPYFKENKLNTKFLIWDHNKERILYRAKESIALDKQSNIWGIAYHYYSGDYFEELEMINKLYPNKLLIHTEGCTGYSNFRKSDEIQNGEIYGHDIMGDLNSGSNGYIDWNMVLDYKGGPNHKKNYCNSPIMINKNNMDYIKNLTFYYIGHFSKYIKPNSRRIGLSKFTDKIEATAFKNFDNSIAVVLLNRNEYNIEYNLNLNGKIFHDNLDKHCIVTFVIK